MSQIYINKVFLRLPLQIIFAINICLFAFISALSQVPAQVPMHSHEPFKDKNFKAKEIKPGTIMPHFAPKIPSDDFTINTNFTGSTLHWVE